LLITYNGHNANVNGVAFHPSGKQVVSSDADGEIQIWNVSDGKKTGDIAKEFLDPGGARIFGKSVLKGEDLRGFYDPVVRAAEATPVGKAMLELVPERVALLTAGRGSEGAFLIVAGEASGLDLAVAGPEVCAILDGRGGGRAPFFQGKATAVDRSGEAVALLRSARERGVDGPRPPGAAGA